MAWNQFSSMDEAYKAMADATMQAAQIQANAAKEAASIAKEIANLNIDYLKETNGQALALITPYQQIGMSSSKGLLDLIGVNGPQAQQAMMSNASQLAQQAFNTYLPQSQQMQNNALNTASNYSSNFMNNLLGYNTGFQGNPTPQMPQAQPVQQVQQPSFSAPQRQSFQVPGALASQLEALQKQGAPTAQKAQLTNPYTTEYNQLNQQYSNLVNSYPGASGSAEAAQLRAKIQGLEPLYTSAEGLIQRYNSGQLNASDQKMLEQQIFNAQTNNNPSPLNREGLYQNLLQQINQTNTANEKATGDYNNQLATIQSQISKARNEFNAAQPSAVPKANTTQSTPSSLNFNGNIPNIGLQNSSNPVVANLTNQLQQGMNYFSNPVANSQQALGNIMNSAAIGANTMLGDNVRNAGNQQLGIFNQGLQNIQNGSQMNSFINQGASAADRIVGPASNPQANSLISALTNSINQQSAPGYQQQQVQGMLDQAGRATAPLTSRANALYDNLVGASANPNGYVNGILNSLIDPATGAVNTWMNSKVVTDVLDSMNKYGADAVQNSAAAKGMLNSGNTLNELYKMGQGNAGQYIVPYAGQLANNVLTQGVGAANNLLNTGVNAANNLMGNATTQQGQILGANTDLINSRNNMLVQGANVANTMNGQNLNARTSVANNIINSGMNTYGNLIGQAGSQGANLLGQDLSARAGLANNIMGQGTSLYNNANSNLAQMLGTGAGYASNLINTQANMQNNLNSQLLGYNQNALNNAYQSSAGIYNNAYNQMTNGLNSIYGQGLNAAQSGAGVLGGLGQQVAGQNTYYGDAASNSAMAAAGALANALTQSAGYNFLSAQNQGLPAVQQSGGGWGNLLGNLGGSLVGTGLAAMIGI